MTPEGKVLASITRWLTAQDIWWLKIKGGPMQRVAIPDLCCESAGGRFWIEVKRPGGATTAAQDHEHASMRRRGAVVLVADSLASLQQQLSDCGILLTKN